MKHTFQFTFDDATGEFSVVNTETGVVVDAKVSKPKKTTKKKKKEDESNEPTLILEEKKYSLNSAAVELMEVNPDDKIDIKYTKEGGKTVILIASDDNWGTKAGNRLTKTFTVACRGSKNDELSKFGTEFKVIPHNEKVGIFILQPKGESTEILPLEVNGENLEEEFGLPIDEDLTDLLDDEDANITEIDSSIFDLNL